MTAVFNSNDYELQTVLTEARADLLYCLREGDNIHEASLTVPHFYAQIVDPPNESNGDLTLGANAATVRIGGGNAAVQTTIKKLKTQGVLKAEGGVETTSVEVTGASTHTGSVEVTGMLYANGGVSMGSALIDLGLPTAPRVSTNLGYVFTSTSFSAVNLGSSGISRALWNFDTWPVGVWVINILLEFTAHPGISNLAVSFGSSTAYRKYGWIQQPTTVTQSKSVNFSMCTAFAMTVQGNLQINCIANYTGTVPSLIAAGSSVTMTRVG
jgi:hypothetical protein